MHILLVTAFLVPCVAAQEALPPAVAGATAIDLLVRDAAGKPLRGAPIGLGRNGKNIEFVATGQVTDKLGRCRVVVDPSQGFGRDVAVAVLGAFRSPCAAVVDLLLPPAGPLELVVPRCGQVRFILYGRDERPRAGLIEARLALAGDQRQVAALELGTDNALFPLVEIEQEIAVTARCSTVAGPLVFRGPGPQHAGEFLILEGRLAKGPPLVALTVVDGDGAPVADEVVGVQVRGDGVHVQVEQQTGPDGGLLVALGESAAPARTLRVQRRGRGESSVPRGAAIGACDALPSGVKELGRLQLVAEPVVLRGRIVGPDGAPLAGVVLRAPMSFASRSELPSFVHRVATDADGAFSLHELSPGTDAMVSFEVDSQRWGAGEPLRALLGGAPPLFRLLPTGTVGLAFAGDREGLRLDVQFVQRESGRTTFTRLSDGVLAPVTLLAGIYDVTIGDHGVEFAIPGVEVPAGGAATDARLAAIEPGAGVQVVRARVRDDRDVPVAGLCVWCRPSATARVGRAATTDTAGRAVFLAPRGEGCVSIQELGFEPVSFPIGETDLELKLQRVPPVDVNLAGLPELPAGARWRVRYVHAEAPQGSGHVDVDAGVVRFQPERLGAWRLHLYVDVPLRGDAQRIRMARQLSELQKGLRVHFEVQAMARPEGPQQVAPTREQRAALDAHVGALREILGEKKDK